MDTLDSAMALAIRERLGARDLARSNAVCRPFNVLGNDEHLWRRLLSLETHALVGPNELPEGVESRAKRLFVYNRAWVTGNCRRDALETRYDTRFVETAFGSALPENKNTTQQWSLRGVSRGGVVIDRCDTPTATEIDALAEVDTFFENMHFERKHKYDSYESFKEGRFATSATFINADDANVAISGFADGRLRASGADAFKSYAKSRRWITGKKNPYPALVYPLDFEADGKIAKLAALDSETELDSDAARIVVAAVDTKNRKRAHPGAGRERGVLLTMRVPSFLPNYEEHDDGEGMFGVTLPAIRGGWFVTHDEITALRSGGESTTAGVFFAGTASGMVEKYDLGNGQPRVVNSFVGQCACHVADVGRVFDNQIVATYQHHTRGTGHANGCLVFDTRHSGNRVAVVELPKCFVCYTGIDSNGDSSYEAPCALHVDTNKVILAQADGHTHVFDRRTWTEVSSFHLRGNEEGKIIKVNSFCTRGARVAAQVVRENKNATHWNALEPTVDTLVTGTVGG